MVKEINKLKNEKLELTKDKQKLQDNIRELSKQIKQIQSAQSSVELNEFEEQDIIDRIDKMLGRIYCITGSQKQSIGIVKIENLKSYWHDLLPETQRDIFASVRLLEMGDVYDIALLPLLRGLEREIGYKIFSPFARQEEFKLARNTNCLDPRYNMQHDSLKMKNNLTPTLGAIKYLGNLVNDPNANRASDLISLFRQYISPVAKEFTEICNDMENCRFGNKKVRLVDVRNGIAHGKPEIINMIDAKLYNSLMTVLYSPPMEILSRVVRISKKIEILIPI